MERGLRPFPSKTVLDTPLTPRSFYFDYPWTPGYSVAQQRVQIPYSSNTAAKPTPSTTPLASSTTAPQPQKKNTPAKSSTVASSKPAKRYSPSKPPSSATANTKVIKDSPVPKITNESAGVPRQETTVTEPKLNLPTASTPVQTQSNTISTAPAIVPPSSLPYGKNIPNRPGMVNSPYAASHQIVDVTGLKPGQEVKCPFTGKLFRVPGSEQAANKPKVPEISSPDNAPKKP
jgi:hypothetical protein